jgi:acyl carrier protein
MSEDRLQEVFQAILGPQVPVLSDDDSPETIETWDSANHLGLMLAIEAEFGVELDIDEMSNLTTVGAIRKRVASG